MEDDEPEHENQFDDVSFKKPPKNPKASARAKYNRRKIAVSHALDQLEYAIDDVLSQGGTIYKREEAERIKESIRKFRDETGIITKFEVPQRNG